MDCKEAQTLFSEYVDRELKKQILASLKEHLMDCPSCQAEYQIFQMNLKILRKLKTLDPPRDYISFAPGARATKRS
jgi:predicted anti-sigma-YlaC factor YlaD